MKKSIIGLVFLVALSGCMSTPYQSTGLNGGYGEMQIGEDVWRVAFGGNGFTTRETAQTYWLYRCAELALERGFDGFELLSHMQLVLPITPEEFFETARPFLPTAAGAPIYIPIFTGRSSHPRIEGDIRLLKQPIDPEPPRVFEARELKVTLEPYVNGKKCDVNNTTGNVCPHVHEYLFPKGKLNRPGV